MATTATAKREEQALIVTRLMGDGTLKQRLADGKAQQLRRAAGLLDTIGRLPEYADLASAGSAAIGEVLKRLASDDDQ